MMITNRSSPTPGGGSHTLVIFQDQNSKPVLGTGQQSSYNAIANYGVPTLLSILGKGGGTENGYSSVTTLAMLGEGAMMVPANYLAWGWFVAALKKFVLSGKSGGGYPGELIVRPTVFVIGLETDVNVGDVSEIDGYWVAGTHPYYTHRHRLSVK